MRASLTDADRANGPSDVQGTPAFDRIYEEHFPFVWRCLRGLGVPDAALDDAAQDVFLVVHRQLTSFRGESTLRTWLFGILRHVASNNRRSARRKDIRTQLLDASPVNPALGPLERAQHAEAARFVQTFLGGLNDDKRAVFVLAVLEEMSIPEVAEALAIPLNTAYTRLRAARTAFRSALAGQTGQKGNHGRL